VSHTNFNDHHANKLRATLDEEERKVAGVKQGTFAVGLHVVYARANPILLTLGAPGYAVAISFDGPDALPCGPLVDFLKSGTPKSGLHPEKLAGRLFSLFEYQCNNFWEVNERAQCPQFVHRSVVSIFRHDLQSRSPEAIRMVGSQRRENIDKETHGSIRCARDHVSLDLPGES
jgi:hypothetical protein